MSSVAEYHRLVADRLEGARPRVVAAFEALKSESFSAGDRLYVEVHVGQLVEAFPVTVFLDPPSFENSDPDAVLQSLGAVLSEEEEDVFTIWEEGPDGPQQALDQPILDEAAVEEAIILPWVIDCWIEAGCEDLPVDGFAGLHDSAERTQISAERKAGLMTRLRRLILGA